jgi:transcriptional regulator with XRE-family HTH domain
MDVKKEFGIAIRSKRTGLGLSQGTLAERAHLHRTYVTDIERGTRNLTLENISKLAEASSSPQIPSSTAQTEMQPSPHRGAICSIY